MATFSSRIRKGKDELRHEILSYKPGKTVPRNDEHVVFPDKLVIGMVDMHMLKVGIIPALRSAIQGDVESSKLADKRQPSTEDQQEYLTDSISVIIQRPSVIQSEMEKDLQDLAGKVGCMVMLVTPTQVHKYEEWISVIKRITGHVPLCALLPDGDIPKARNELERHGITDIYEVVLAIYSHSDEGLLKWFDLLHGCLQIGDRALAIDNQKKIFTNPRCKLINGITKKEARQPVDELGGEKDRARSENGKRSLVKERTKKLKSITQESVDTLTEIAVENERKETTLKQQVEELRKGRERDRARFEYKEQRMKRLELEIVNLRTQIQEESEMRSAERKEIAEKYQFYSINYWVNYGEQAEAGTSPFEDISTERLGRSDISHAGEEPPDDEFADILKKIAVDLYDGDKIESLGGQLGIPHGDIQRALMTNVKSISVTSDGTRHMLEQWRRGVSREEERMKLRKALKAAKLVDLADRYLKEAEAVGVSQPLNQERKELSEYITAPKVQPDFQKSDSVHTNDGNNEISEVLDGDMEGDVQAPHRLHREDDGSTINLVDTEEPTAEKPCCSWCCRFSYTQIQ